MLFDDPSSSSPAAGDTRFADPHRRARRRASALPLLDHGPIEKAVKAGEPSPAPTPTPTAGAPPQRDARVIETAGAPEPEALRATEIASAVVRELFETGREVRFNFVPTRERVTVLLCDMDGAVLSRLTPARALEIATGEPVPGGRRR
ncbi:MAG: hypothetical protein QOJ35_1708 [Solirubrobacteraceae bacterium]|jgi:hypothetical protein|nr:hypothetical protein [Solirubrobacteraceae bacterium]